MPATTRTARACALALAGLGLTASTMTALPAAAAGDGDTDQVTSTTSTTSTTTQKKRLSAKRRVAQRVLSARDVAMRQRGDAYAYGAAGPDRFDCSGLIRYAYSRAGFDVPRTSSAQAGHTRRIAKKDMRPGDLMFFGGSGGVYHAGIFLRWSRGHAVMLHAPGSGERVRVSVPWTSQWFGGTLRRA
ncbi:C40 family peptidase [Nocardioides ganghwensis]|jgi:cell wall-associated NlpC family hydrolase|uniref:NlpC/P60 family protein n=1 Tax=Nocardioides ganghwensis TaxID=252230 RepID=A0A4Q2SCI1_9ACTN|nr:C40 family peptidase [Nocardioides ganghwensis]MBD3947455.1 C40 family peptidase [Nocardioides ganghwensis]RYB99896.1 NlpC/P60 family protein [Nocardioides ganghwensis]